MMEVKKRDGKNVKQEKSNIGIMEKEIMIITTITVKIEIVK